MTSAAPGHQSSTNGTEVNGRGLTEWTVRRDGDRMDRRKRHRRRLVQERQGL